MANKLCVRVRDVNYRPDPAQNVFVRFEGSSTLEKLQPSGDTDDPAAYEIPIPDGVSQFVVEVADEPEFWPVTQPLVIKPASPVPSLEFRDDKQAINVRETRVIRKGADVSFELFVVHGHLRDATGQCATIAAANNIEWYPDPSLGPSKTVLRHQSPILRSSSASSEPLNRISEDVVPSGKLYMVERKTIPKLVGIYLPPKWNPSESLFVSAISYHLFFHPYMGDGPLSDYPFGHPGFLGVVSTYFFKSWERDFPQVNRNGKTFLYQTEASESSAVFIFPVGAPKRQMGTLNTQSGVLRLLQEVNYWIQRMEGIPYPLWSVGGAALSAFSGGVDFLGTVLHNQVDSKFFHDVLSEVYIFDGVPNYNQSGLTPEIIARDLKRWYRTSHGSQAFRIYTQRTSWWPHLIDALSNPSITQGSDHSHEAESGGGTILYAPVPFWSFISKRFNTDHVHHYFPAKFLEHALSNARL